MQKIISTLQNGLRVLTVPMPTSESATITVWVKTGSRNENKEKLGISHFLEHMVFKGGKKYKTMTEIFELFDRMGAIHNASTSKEWTNFWVKLPVFDIERGFDILSDVVLTPALSSQELKRERLVIFEEMKMIEDVPMRNIGDIFEELIYQGNPLGWDIIGTVDSMNSIKREDFMDYRDKHYFGSNMLLSVAGGVKEDQIIKLAMKYFQKLPEGKIKDISKFTPSQIVPKVRIKNKKTDQAHFMLGFLGEGRNYENRYPQSVLSLVLGGGGSSRLWTEVREKRGLAYAVQGSMDRYSDVGYFGVYVGCDIAKTEEATKVILDQCYGLSEKRYKITPKELEKVKGFIKGHLALSLEDSEHVNDFFSEQVLFDKKVLSPEEIFKKVDAVTIDEVYEEAEKLFKSEGLNLAIIGPYENDEKFVKIIK